MNKSREVLTRKDLEELKSRTRKGAALISVRKKRKPTDNIQKIRIKDLKQQLELSKASGRNIVVVKKDNGDEMRFVIRPKKSVRHPIRPKKSVRHPIRLQKSGRHPIRPKKSGRHPIRLQKSGRHPIRPKKSVRHQIVSIIKKISDYIREEPSDYITKEIDDSNTKELSEKVERG